MPAKKASSPIHFVTGNDEAGVKKAARALAEELAPGADAFGLETIDGSADTVDAAVSRMRQAMDALATLPFLGGTKLVWLKDAAFLSDSVAGGSEATLAMLEKFCGFLEEGLPPGVTFLLSACKPDKRRSAYKRLSKLGSVVVCDKPELGFRSGERDVVEWTAGEARSRGLAFSEKALEALAARVGLEPGRLGMEFDKLETAFGKNHEISAADVRALVPATRESGVFDLGNAIQSHDLPLALATLDQLLQQGEKGIGILLASIVPTVRNLVAAKGLLQRHNLRTPAQPHDFAGMVSRLPERETGHLPRKKDGTINAYGLGVAAVASANYTMERLQAALHECADANWALVSSKAPEGAVLAKLLVGLMGESASDCDHRGG